MSVPDVGLSDDALVEVVRSSDRVGIDAPFCWPDEVGHLPIYGAMLVLLVYGSDPQLRPAVSALWPWSRPRLGSARARPAASSA